MAYQPPRRPKSLRDLLPNQNPNGDVQDPTSSSAINRQAAYSQGNRLHPVGGTVVNLDTPLNPEQQFEQERAALNPMVDQVAIANPYSDTDARTQRANALMSANQQLAQNAYGLIPGQDDYTIKPTNYDQMSWSPDQQYSYEDQKNQTRGATTGLDAQTAALQGYSDIANQGGLTAIDRASIAQSHAGQEQELRANRQAIMQNAQEQGRAGGNAQMLAQMQASQGTANNRAMADLQTNALALQRKDSAIGAMGNLGGQVQSAQDSIDRFNTEGERQRQEYNVKQKNAGIDTKYQDERTTRNSNTQLANTAEQLNKSDDYGARGRYGDQHNAITDIQNANEARAAYETNRQNAIQQAKQQKIQNVMGGIGTVTNAAAGAAKSVV